MLGADVAVKLAQPPEQAGRPFHVLKRKVTVPVGSSGADTSPRHPESPPGFRWTYGWRGARSPESSRTHAENARRFGAPRDTRPSTARRAARDARTTADARDPCQTNIGDECGGCPRRRGADGARCSS
jgi:hypothetical protein